MKTALCLTALVLTLGLTLGADDAEAARRLGGGKSSGMQRQSALADKPAVAPGQAATAPAASNMAAKSPAAAPAVAAQPKRSWMGPLAGLAAGLGLAALASHFGFGEGLANMLMIGLLVMAALAVVGFILRKRAASQRPALASVNGMQYAGAGPSAPAQRAYDVSLPGSSIGSAIGSNIGSNVASRNAIPADFDEAAFVRNAKVQFIRLQAANDAGKLDDIREFTTPEMFAEFKMDIVERGATAQQTDVINVDATVLEVVEEDARYVVSVRFTGTTREDKQPATEAFDEIWHLVKPRTGASGWLLSGIQQVAPAQPD